MVIDGYRVPSLPLGINIRLPLGINIRLTAIL